ncbi:hypothetical protein NDU88_002462 [Pleurodeles waltl]|uniref:Uncharacterized protein n=1 Tax=Pleurodeles waltl TaxID=8319 RepID=A0AAV7UD89_PLEWA|nr:hypothetical protein NDU88_002462 [Pleurodeles waltl]
MRRETRMKMGPQIPSALMPEDAQMTKHAACLEKHHKRVGRHAQMGASSSARKSDWTAADTTIWRLGRKRCDWAARCRGKHRTVDPALRPFQLPPGDAHEHFAFLCYEDVLLAISACRVALEGKIDALASDLMVLRDDHRRLAEKVTATDKQLEELHPEIKDNTSMTRQMEKRIQALELRAESGRVS